MGLTLDEITTLARRNEPVDARQLQLAVCAYDVLLSRLALENNAVQLQEYFVAGDASPADYLGHDNSPDNPEFIKWHKAFIT